jgi:hypothetical protein
MSETATGEAMDNDEMLDTKTLKKNNEALPEDNIDESLTMYISITRCKEIVAEILGPVLV